MKAREGKRKFAGYRAAQIHERNQQEAQVAPGHVSCEGLFQSILQ